VPEPGKIVCVGMNYRDHAEEQDEPIPEKPLLFGKAPTAVTNPGSPIRRPPEIEKVDYEVELGVVVGREAHRVDAADAEDTSPATPSSTT
jgi:2-keto-4-pentenoate hydratase/2-oxohepta-3-ene-1,7-dioic acid hydratase in catechol pathway